jgi:hypothetical protein
MTWFVLLFQVGLRYNEKAIAAGAQTERRGRPGPLRGLLGGSTAPAAFRHENGCS